MINIDDRLLNEVNEQEMYLMLHIAKHMKQSRMTAWPSVETLCKACKWDERTVKKWRSSLVQKGFLKMVIEPGTKTVYSFLRDGIGVYNGLKSAGEVEEEAQNQPGTKNAPPTKNAPAKNVEGTFCAPAFFAVEGVHFMPPEVVNNKEVIKLKEEREGSRKCAPPPSLENQVFHLEAKKEKKEMVAPAAPREFSPTPPVAVILYEQISGTPTKVAIHEPEAATSTVIKPRTAKPAPKPRTVEIPESHKELAPQIMELLTKRPYLTKSDAALTREMTLFFSLPAKFCQWHIQNSLDRSKGVWDSLMYAGWEETYQRWLRLQPPAPGAAPLQAIRQTNFRNPTEAYWEPSQYRRQK